METSETTSLKSLSSYGTASSPLSPRAHVAVRCGRLVTCRGEEEMGVDDCKDLAMRGSLAVNVGILLTKVRGDVFMHV